MLSQVLQQHSPQLVTELGPHASWLLYHNQCLFQSIVGQPSTPPFCPSGRCSTASSQQVLGCCQAVAAIHRQDAALVTRPKLRQESTPKCPTHKRAVNAVYKHN